MMSGQMAGAASYGGVGGGSGLVSYPQLPVQSYYVQPGYVFLLRQEYDKLLEAKHTLDALRTLLTDVRFGDNDSLLQLELVSALIAQNV